MTEALKSFQNNALAALTQRAPAGVLNAIKTASAKTGVDFAYLMEKAAAESSFQPDAKAKTSSATGLFQFIESTWIGMVKEHGAKYGIDPSQDKKSLLELRNDPKLASFMAAEFAKGNQAHLEKTVGGEIGNTELYFAHFMGASGASAFLSQLEKNPLSTGADLFPAAAKANRNVFYDADTGAPKTLQAIYDFFDKKFQAGSDTQLTETPIDTPLRVEKEQTAQTNSLVQNALQREGYQHIPPSLKKPIEIIDGRGNRVYEFANGNERHIGSLYQIQNQLDAFFSQKAGVFPASAYDSKTTATSVLLSILK